ncbi:MULTISPECIES: hypothetical protein [unclassified Streptomyces]|uniref:hypothetical protein n=1 Tax=unclassified Streptomyces TaxID=2593676 RepID=UPI002DDBBA93|nr:MULTISPECIES: hypothetical protein [unclassified Streptomyces]WSF89130.1 hypothetical protein OIE70_42220 [Streptomyces sp. NBC_01744]WSC34701.1 hypothetical protein OHA08_03660 [Streptomyces sp. NBC_01763]WSC43109.1 hypothetical protein OIE61_03515 [Streptomyces sp. NBC_01762]WSC58030.1 hypothetical protein OG808_40675 [Streptomyces sp. NBC_01761]WSD22646.1 hypothetical protein OHA26_03575 [Streptomyces sp. NBC_01751]
MSSAGSPAGPGDLLSAMAEGREPGEFIVVLPARATVVSAYLDPFVADNARGGSPTAVA